MVRDHHRCRVYGMFRIGVRLAAKIDCAPVHSKSGGDSSGRTAVIGRCRIPVVRWPADRSHRSIARRWRYANAHAGQLCRLLAHGASVRLRLMLQAGMGRARPLDRALRWPDDHRIGLAGRLAQEKAFLSLVSACQPLIALRIMQPLWQLKMWFNQPAFARRRN